MLRYKDTTQVFTTADSVILAGLCVKCPYTEGFVVFRARALFNMVFHTIEAFADECNANTNGSRLGNATEETTEQQFKVELYPNPNNGLFTIETDTEMEELKVKINDVAGKEIYNSTLKISNYSNSLHLDLKNGVYFVEIQSNNTKTKTIKKLVIYN